MGDSVEKILVTACGKSVRVDPEVYEWAQHYRWRLVGSKRGIYYPARTLAGLVQKLHRLVIGARPGQIIDHINGDPLDNRLCNLRICTQSQNMMNRRPNRKSSSPYKGVTFSFPDSSNPYCARIRIDGRKTHLGCFATAEDAARAYDLAALKHFGEFAHLNFPGRAV